MLRWVPFACLAAIFILTTLGGAREDRALFGTCHQYPVNKTFIMRRLADNNSCTFKIPTFQCGGYCETETLFMKSELNEETGMYELVSKSNGCKCCEGVFTRRVPIPPNTLECEESKNIFYDGAISVLHDGIGGCSCRRCRASIGNHVSE